MERIIRGKYKLGRKIGSGSFGEVYEATQIDTFQRVAVKIEKGNNRDSCLMEEARIYTILQGKSGIPKILWWGTDEDENILVLELLGPNLQLLFERCGRKLTLKTFLLLAIQMIGRIEYMHSKGILHRDIKPENFVMGVGNQRNQVYIIDFGLAKSYLDPATNRHIPCRLPWQDAGVSARNQWNAMTSAMKYSFLQVVDPLPTELVYYFNYCRHLKFDQNPDYNFLKQLFYDRYYFEGYASVNYFDWTGFQYQRARRASALPQIFRSEELPLPALANPDVPMEHDASSQVQSESSAPVTDPASRVGSSSRWIQPL